MAEKIKALPFICSRTKNVDFLNQGFLVMPQNLDWGKIKPFVKDAMDDISLLCGFRHRYALFCDEQYCIFGLACITLDLVKEIKGDIHSPYLRDCKDRIMQCFIGYAIPRRSINDNSIPRQTVSDEFLSKYWELYCKYIEHQWEKSIVEPERVTLNKNAVELEPYQCTIEKPEIEVWKEKGAISASDEQAVMDYYLYQALHSKEEISLLINSVDDSLWKEMRCKYAIVEPSTMASIRSDKQKKIEEGKEKIKKANGIINKLNKYVEDVTVKLKNANGSYEKNISDLDIDGMTKRIKELEAQKEKKLPNVSEDIKEAENQYEFLEKYRDEFLEKYRDEFLEKYRELLEVIKNLENVISNSKEKSKEYSDYSETLSTKIGELKQKIIKAIMDEIESCSDSKELDEIKKELENLQKKYPNYDFKPIQTEIQKKKEELKEKEEKSKLPQDFENLKKWIIETIGEDEICRILNGKIESVKDNDGNEVGESNKEGFKCICLIYGIIENNNHLKRKLKFSISFKNKFFSTEKCFSIDENQTRKGRK
jgi:hypothetical protein